MHPSFVAERFRSARDQLVSLRDDYPRALAEFAWPRSEGEFNWAIDSTLR